MKNNVDDPTPEGTVPHGSTVPRTVEPSGTVPPYLDTDGIEAAIAGPALTPLLDRVSAALAAHPGDIYRRDGRLVRPLRRDSGEVEIQPVPLPVLVERLDAACRVAGLALPPKMSWSAVARALVVRGAWPGIRRLRLVTATPLTLADGTTTPEGYDGRTGVLYIPPIVEAWELATAAIAEAEIDRHDRKEAKERDRLEAVAILFGKVVALDDQEAARVAAGGEWRDTHVISGRRPLRSAEDWRERRWCASWLVERDSSAPFGIGLGRALDKITVDHLRNLIDDYLGKPIGRYTLVRVGTPDRTRRTMYRVEVARLPETEITPEVEVLARLPEIATAPMLEQELLDTPGAHDPRRLR